MLGFASEKGRRPDNQDYVGARLGRNGATGTPGVIAAVADGVGGHAGGREAAELTVRSFIDAYCGLPETLGAQRRAARALAAVNGWIHAMGRRDPGLAGMSCTFSALILAGRAGHVVHVGDSRIYRLADGRLERLTSDHVMGQGALSHVLTRAVGLDDALRIDHRAIGLRIHDRFLLCSDGVHGALGEARLAALLGARAAPEESARAIVAAALGADDRDNATALVLDVLDLPAADQDDLTRDLAELPILALPQAGDRIDGYAIGEVVSDGRYSRLYRAQAADEARPLALKFPHPRVATERAYRLAFVREAWVAARVRSPFIGEVIEPPPGRRTRLYSVAPFYEGETLERRLIRSPPGLREGVGIAIRLARAVATLHRAGIIHRDIKPDNVILPDGGGLRLIDLGVARAPGLEEFPVADIPGTPSYMAPELFRGATGDEASDLYALGVTVYRLFSGGYPYGEIEPFMTPRFGKYASLSRLRPDLPAWLDAALARAVAIDPAERFGDVLEFAHELENADALARPAPAAKVPLYQRDPLRVWQAIAFALLLVVLALLAPGGGRLR